MTGKKSEHAFNKCIYLLRQIKLCLSLHHFSTSCTKVTPPTTKLHLPALMLVDYTMSATLKVSQYNTKLYSILCSLMMISARGVSGSHTTLAQLSLTHPSHVHCSRLTPKLKFLYQERATQERTTNTPKQFGKLYW